MITPQQRDGMLQKIEEMKHENDRLAREQSAKWLKEQEARLGAKYGSAGGAK